MRRWDIDERQTGITDGTAMDPQVESLLAAMRRDGWVTEEPEVHLLPHLKKACGQTWRIVRDRLIDDGVYEVTLAIDDDLSGVALHRAAVGLLAAIAEQVFFVRQSEPRVFDCVTGMLDGDPPVFKSHGHLVRLVVE